MEIKTVLLACFLAVVLAEGDTQRSTRFRESSFNLEQEIQRFNSLDYLDVDFRETTTPVPILRHVDTKNPDGSYTYGFESADGTYKIETRYATGEVKGKYGYYDDVGQLREVEYGAKPERGFEPRAEGLVVAPPTIHKEPEFNPEPEIALPQPQPAPVRNSRPTQPIRKTVVRRPRPQPSAPRQSAVQPRPLPRPTVQQPQKFQNFQPRPQPAVRQERPRSRPAVQARPAVRPQPAFQPRPRPQPAVPQQNRFQAQQRFTPIAAQQQAGPLPASVSFFNHPYISDINPASGVYSYSYGK